MEINGNGHHHLIEHKKQSKGNHSVEERLSYLNYDVSSVPVVRSLSTLSNFVNTVSLNNYL